MARTRTGHPARALVALGLTATALTAFGGTADAASPQASCTGLAVSSLAGEPGVVAQLTRELHQALKDAGMPPGSIDAIFSQLHEGSVDACLAALE